MRKLFNLHFLKHRPHIILMGKKFRFLEGATADILFDAFGETLEECFSNAGKAVFEVMSDTSIVKPDEREEFEITSKDEKSLLFDFLNELIYLSDCRKMFFSSFNLKITRTDSGLSLKAVCFGEKINPKRHELRTEVKACTYHSMDVKKNGKWRARVLLDV